MIRSSAGVLGVCLLCAAALGAGCASGAEEPGRLVDAAGREHGLEALLEDGPLLLVWVEPDCPIARAYVPELERIAADYAARGLRAALVDAHPTRDAGGLARAMSERGIQRYACYDDRGARLA